MPWKAALSGEARSDRTGRRPRRNSSRPTRKSRKPAGKCQGFGRSSRPSLSITAGSGYPFVSRTRRPRRDDSGHATAGNRWSPLSPISSQPHFQAGLSAKSRTCPCLRPIRTSPRGRHGFPAVPASFSWVAWISRHAFVTMERDGPDDRHRGVLPESRRIVADHDSALDDLRARAS
jgi:hypothetical protein